MTPGGASARTAAAAAAAAGGLALSGLGAWVVGAGATAAAAATAWHLARRAGEGAQAQAGRLTAGPPGDAERELLAALPVGLLLVEEDGEVAFANAAAEEILGRRPPGRFPASLLRAPKLLEAIEAGLAGSGPGQVDFTLSRGGERHILARLAPVRGPEDAPGPTPALVVVLEDRTHIRRAEELHRDFVANASHELKTPLSAISGLIETLQGHARDDPEAAARFLEMMGQQAERMRSLVNDLLSLNRIEINERIRPTDPQCLRHIMGEVAEGMRPIAAAAGATLEVSLPEEGVVVPGSFEELAQVLRNLIDNAVKYGAGRISVAAHTDPDRPETIAVTVSDDGPGIAREHIPRLTERFYRVSVSRSRARGGTGLGLAIVKHVVSRHRGQLEIDSRPGRGSRFTVWLPRETGAGAAS